MPCIEKRIERAAKLIKKASFAVAFTGAGISTPSGIPDFRSPNSGLWNNVDPFTVASIDGFVENPDAFYSWIYPLARLISQAQPNPAHYTLHDLEAHGYLKAIITQNIDMLHSRAGSQQICELHGHMREVSCIQCHRGYPAGPIIEQFLANRQVPYCPECTGVLKPNVILFGEQLPPEELFHAKALSCQADLMLVVGSYLEVAPASELPYLAIQNGAKLIIVNLEATAMDNLAEVVLHTDAATVLPQIKACLETI